MSDVLYRYIQCFLHPIEAQKGMGGKQSNVVGIHGHEIPSTNYHLSFEEGLSFSWLFAILQAFYIVLIMALGIDTFSVQNESIELLGKNYAVKIFFIVLEVIFFPLSYWFYAKFWSKVIFLSSKLFSLEPEERQVDCEDIIVKSMTSHALLIVPIFGQLFSQLVMFIYLFQGVKIRLNFTPLQALFVMLVPFFILFLSTALMAISVIITFAGVR